MQKLISVLGKTGTRLALLRTPYINLLGLKVAGLQGWTD